MWMLSKNPSVSFWGCDLLNLPCNAGIELVAAARAQARRNVTEASTQAYQQPAASLNMTQTKLRTYVWTRTWKQRVLDGKGTVITGLSSPIVQA